MLERSEKLLRFVCLILAAAVVAQIALIVAHHNPLGRFRIPAVPTLAAADSQTGAKGTNAATVAESVKKSTNAPGGSVSGIDGKAASFQRYGLILWRVILPAVQSGGGQERRHLLLGGQFRIGPRFQQQAHRLRIGRRCGQNQRRCPDNRGTP